MNWKRTKVTTYIFSNNIIEGGWITKSFTDVINGLNYMATNPPDAVIFDIGSVGINSGKLRTLRQLFGGPLIILGGGTDAAKAIEMGANDFVEDINLAEKVVSSAVDRFNMKKVGRDLNETITKVIEKTGRS